MNRDRLTQLLALLIALGCLGAAGVMMPRIDQQRRQLQLTYDPVTGHTDPKIALLTTAAGSFRGILVDALWYRAEMLKREGKHHEASSLADFITTLQPRFPQVWAFNGWNLAFNVSVQTHTPTERWDWVSKGERLLREKGIRYNPNAVQLYKELGWIWFFKIGGTTDDHHAYYKLQVANEYNELLGPYAEAGDTAAVLRAFKPISDAADRYFVFSRPPRDIRDGLLNLAALEPGLSDAIDALLGLDIEQLVPGLNKLARTPDLSKDTRAQIDALRVLAGAAQARARQDPLTALYTDHPATRDAVAALREAGGAVDTATTRRLGRLAAILRALYFPDGDTALRWARQALPPEDQRLVAWIMQPTTQQALPHLRPFLQAQALTRDYNMDPGVMYDKMVEYGPLDFRHPYAHSLYWSSLGVEKAGQILDRTKVDVLNTYRQVIHSLQGLTDFGRVNYEPLNQTVTYQPDPRFIDSYIAAVDEGKQIVENPDDQVEFGSGVMRSFRAGHENFLQMATYMAYIYGTPGQARRYYDQLKEQYGVASPTPSRLASWYELDLPQFVNDILLEDNDMQKINRSFVDGLLTRAIADGLARRRLDVFDRLISLAAAAHKRYNQLRDNPNPTATAQRLTLPPLPEMIVSAYASYMRDPRIPPSQRASVYQFTAVTLPQLAARAYPIFRPGVIDQIRSSQSPPPGSSPRAPGSAGATSGGGGGGAEAVFDRLFPRPPGLDPPGEVGPTDDATNATIKKQ